MDVISEAQNIIINLLKNEGAMSVEKIVNKLFKEYKISEREVKETILQLREEGIIKPNSQWKMKYVVEA